MRRTILAAAALFAAVLAAGHALAQYAPRHWITTASTNATLVFSGAAQIGLVQAINASTTAAFLKLYDTNVAPTCGTGTPVLTVPVGASGAPPALIQQLLFVRGVGFCVTGGLADSDSSAGPANVVINLGLSGR